MCSSCTFRTDRSVKVKIDEFDLFVRGGMQYRVNTEEWIDVPGGYAHPCELLGEP